MKKLRKLFLEMSLKMGKGTSYKYVVQSNLPKLVLNPNPRSGSLTINDFYYNYTMYYETVVFFKFMLWGLLKSIYME